MLKIGSFCSTDKGVSEASFLRPRVAYLRGSSLITASKGNLVFRLSASLKSNLVRLLD